MVWLERNSWIRIAQLQYFCRSISRIVFWMTAGANRHPLLLREEICSQPLSSPQPSEGNPENPISSLHHPTPDSLVSPSSFQPWKWAETFLSHSHIYLRALVRKIAPQPKLHFPRSDSIVQLWAEKGMNGDGGGRWVRPDSSDISLDITAVSWKHVLALLYDPFVKQHVYMWQWRWAEITRAKTLKHYRGRHVELHLFPFYFVHCVAVYMMSQLMWSIKPTHPECLGFLFKVSTCSLGCVYRNILISLFVFVDLSQLCLMLFLVCFFGCTRHPRWDFFMFYC